MIRNISKEDVYRAIRQVMHPAISRSLVDLGMAKDITMETGKVTLTHWIDIIKSTARNSGNGRRRQEDLERLKLVLIYWRQCSRWIKRMIHYCGP